MGLNCFTLDQTSKRIRKLLNSVLLVFLIGAGHVKRFVSLPLALGMKEKCESVVLAEQDVVMKQVVAG